MRTAFKALVALKGLRGTAWDVLGRTEERRLERQLIADYQATIEEVLSRLTLDNHAQAVALLQLPEGIKGFGHVKERHARAVLPQWEQQRAAWADQKQV
jgi:indolepyruvate ferredoxin oxidoreductase